LLLHPVMVFLLEKIKDGVNLTEWIDNLPGDGIKIDNYGSVSNEEIRYYYRKYLLFLENDFFSAINKKEKFSGRVPPEQVCSLLSNVTDVVFETTDACNLKCKYCGFGEYYEDYDKREKKNLSFKMAKNLLDHLLEFWLSPLNMSHKNKINIGFYGGEPLLNIELIKKIVDYLQKIESLRHTFTFRMTTNALLLEKNMDFLVKNNFGLLISLDGNREHNGYRVFHDGREAHEDIFRNITALKNKYPAYFKKKINFNVVLHNKNSISEIYNYFKENFDKIPSISELSPNSIRHEKREEFLNMYRNSLESLKLSKDHLKLEKEMFQRLPNIKALCMIIDNCSNHCFRDYSQLLYSTKNQKRTPTGTCLPFSKKVFLSVNGKIMPCERIGHQNYFGTVDENTVNLDAQNVSRLINNYFDKIRNQCFTCYKADICTICIYNLKIDGDQKLKKCPEYMEAGKFSSYLSRWLSELEKNPEYYSRIMEEVYTS
jgi:uncharacterized protein